MKEKDKEKDEKSEKSYRFRELKCYASTEWLADNHKKYRQVFERNDISYVYAELSFVNKKFDLESWEANIELKCFQQAPIQKEICKLKLQRKISKHENIAYIREGWGNKKLGQFWKRGTYYWQAFIEGELVGTKYFYVEDMEESSMDIDDDYLEIRSLKCYEGGFDDVNAGEREYQVTFYGDETRYVYLEIILENKNIEENWVCELFVKFFNEAKELKGQVVRLIKVKKGQKYIELSAGWGSNISGSWREGEYSCDIIFMDRWLATVPFEIGDEEEAGIPEVFLPDSLFPRRLHLDEEDTETYEDLKKRLQRLVGLEKVKTKIEEQSQYIQFIQLRKSLGFEENDDINLHSVFIGNPGTGKTTVARMLGKIYHEMGILSRGHVYEADRVELVGEYIGQTAPKVKEVFNKARGGVLFIDEAYALARSEEDSKDFGREVIEMLVKEMSDGEGDLVVVAAGYPDEMKRFLESNPGLRSRFKMYYEFYDYLPEELIQIAELAAEEKEVFFSPSAKKRMNQLLTSEYRSRDRSFGNARFVYDLVDRAKIQLGLRVMKLDSQEELTKEQLSEITAADLDNINIPFARKRLRLPIDEKLLEVAMQELDALIGMEEIKTEIKETVSLVRYHLESGKEVLKQFFLHTLFIGNPGTGKTTVARILTKIYKALGILERGQMIETDRQGLVAGYVGQTAIKTAKRIDEAIGGVLFIDEAYALGTRTTGMGDFGDEAIQTIIKRMEDDRGEFFVFAAGYPDNMEAFLKINPGLKSRFDKVLKFNDYSARELFDIGLKILEEKDLYLDEKAKEYLAKYIEFLHQFKDRYFGNARVVRKIIDDIAKYQNLRLASLTEEERHNQDLSLVIMDDLKSFKLSKDDLYMRRRGIGFNRSSNA